MTIEEAAGGALEAETEVPWKKLKEGKHHKCIKLVGLDSSLNFNPSITREEREKIMGLFNAGQLKFAPLNQV